MAKTINALASIITLIHGDRTATIEQLTEAFASDFAHFATSNNRQPLNEAIKALAKSPKDKAIAEAINEAYQASSLTVGYIGAQTGPFAKQPSDVQERFNSAITRATSCFHDSIDGSEAFAAKVPKTDADKAKAKEAKEAKKLESDNALITAKIQAGELVRADQIRPYPMEEIDGYKLTIETMGIDAQKLQDQINNLTFQLSEAKNENAYLANENATLQTSVATLTAKKSKVAKVA